MRHEWDCATLTGLATGKQPQVLGSGDNACPPDPHLYAMNKCCGFVGPGVSSCLFTVKRMMLGIRVSVSARRLRCRRGRMTKPRLIQCV
jgi:hypothetical protein